MALNNLGLGFVITASDAASAVFNRVRGSFDRLSNTVDAKKQALSDISGELQSVGRWMMGAGAAGLLGLGAASMAAADFGKAIAEVRTIADAAEFPIERIQSLAIEMAGTYGGDLTGQVKALYDAISSGASNASQANGLLHASNKLAIGGLTDAATAMNLLVGTANAYSIAFEDAESISDKFFTMINLGITTAPEIASAFGRIAPTAAAAGVSLDELAASIAAVTLQGISTKEAVTGMKAALANIFRPTADAAEEAKRLGIEFNAAGLRSKGFAEFLKDIMQRTGGNKDSLIKLFGSIEALNTMFVLASEAGNKSFLSTLDAMSKSGGATTKAFGILRESTTSLAAIFKANLQVALVQVGQAIEPLVVLLLKGATMIVQAFIALPAPVKQAIVVLVALSSVLLLVVGAGFILAGMVAGALAVGIEVLAIVVAAAVNLLGQLGVVFALGGLAVAGFRVALEKNVGGVATFFASAASSVRAAWGGISQLFESGRLSGSVLEELNKAENSGLKGFVVTVYVWGNRILGFFDGIKEGFTDAVSEMGPTFQAMSSALTRVGAAFGLAQDGPSETASKWSAVNQVGQTLGRGLAAVFEFMAQAVTIAMRVFDGFVTGMKRYSFVFEALGNAVMSIVQAFGMILSAFSGTDAAADENRSAWEGVGEAIAVVASVIVGVVSLIAGAVSAVAYVLSGFAHMIAGAFSGAVTLISGVLDIIVGLFEGLFTGNWTRMWRGAGAVVAGAAKIILSIVFGIASAVAGLFDALAAFFGHDSGGMAKGIQEFSKGLLKDIQQTLGVAEKETVAPTQGLVPSVVVAPSTPGEVPVAQQKPAQPAPLFGVPSAPGMPAQPGVAAAGASSDGFADIAAMLNKPAAPPPVQIESKIKLEVDGQTLADVVERYSTGGRSFGPLPTAT